MEFPKQQEGVLNEERELSPVSFPIVTVDGSYYYDDAPPLQEGTIVHFFEGSIHGAEKRNRYVLLSDVAGLNYVFRLGQASTKDKYGLSFKTMEYEFATTNLDDDGYKELVQTINAFLESVYLDEDSKMKEIHISPADATYSAEDIEGCMEEILKSPKNTLRREELMRKYKGFRIFDLYQELFDKNFQDKHYNDSSRASARSRYFKMMFRKNLPNWEVQDIPGLTNDFDLIRKTDK